MRLLIVILFIITVNFQAKAQYKDSVDVPYGTFKIKRIGAAKNTTSVRSLGEVPTWSRRDYIICGGVVCSYHTYNAITIGYQFFEFGFAELGYLRSRPNKFPTEIGMKVEARVNTNMYGLNVYMSHDLSNRSRHNHQAISAGLGLITYTADANYFIAVRPTVSFHIPYCGISNFEFSYGLNLFMDKTPITTPYSSAATITYRIPFY